MNVTEERALLFKAIAAAQGEFTTVEKNAKNPHFNSKFAPLDSIIEMIRPILPRHGLSVIQFTDIPESGNGVIIETVITHESGQYISGRLQMPTVKQDPQGYGSSISYGRRYALGAALGIVSDEDVDGNQTEAPQRAGKQAAKPAAQQQKELSKAQKDLLEELAQRFTGDEAQMADALHTYSSFQGLDGERYLKLADLSKPNDNDKFQRWVGSALGKLRKDANG